MKAIVRFAKCESGATAIEYGLIASLISVAGFTAVGGELSTLMGTVKGKL